MDDHLRQQVYNNLNLQDTEELLEIWQNGDPSEWEPVVFELIPEILLKRLGSIPPRSGQKQVTKILQDAGSDLQAGKLEQALRECEAAIEMNPGSAAAYNARGEVYIELDQLDAAISDFQTAVHLDSESKVAWENLLIVEHALEEEFDQSSTRQHLDQALEYAIEEEPEDALAECELARPDLPNIAPAHHLFGQVLEEIGQLEPAVEAYLKAIQFNPRFYPARESLAEARVKLEGERFRQPEGEEKGELSEENEIPIDVDPSQYPEIPGDEDLIPEWFYLDETAYWLRGWPGHRTRQGRSGYDPLDTDFEQAHIEGVIIRRLFTGKFRTRNPFYLLIMAFLGMVLSLPLFPGAVLALGDWTGVFVVIVLIPYWFVGVALVINVFLSFWSEIPDQAVQNGHAFF